MGYLIDVTGNESYELRVRDIATGRDRPLKISGVSDFTRASDSATLFYVRHDAEHRARFVYRHRLGNNPAKDPLVYQEKDLRFEVSVDLTHTKRFVVISTDGQDTTENWLIDVAQPASAPVLVAAREHNIQYHISDWGDWLLIRTNADGADDFKIMTAPASAQALYLLVKRLGFLLEPRDLRFWRIGATQLIEHFPPESLFISAMVKSSARDNFGKSTL